MREHLNIAVWSNKSLVLIEMTRYNTGGKLHFFNAILFRKEWWPLKKGLLIYTVQFLKMDVNKVLTIPNWIICLIKLTSPTFPLLW